MKKCPFCAEDIQDEAIKCKHCGEFLDGYSRDSLLQNLTPWYYRTSVIVIAICCVGPLALPLVWFRPNTSLAWKIGLTIGVLLLSWLLFAVSIKIGELMMDEYEKLLGTL